MHRAIFLDRDGIINTMVYNPDFGIVDSPATPDEFELLPNAAEAIQCINQMGFLAVVISNQPGIAKGKYNCRLLKATTGKMYRMLAEAGARLDAVYYCLHHPEALLKEYRVRCDCRKPKPGLLFKAMQELDINLEGSYMVGDGITDVAAGHAAGCTTLFVNSRKCYICAEMSRQRLQPDYVVRDLSEATRLIWMREVGDRLDFAQYSSVSATAPVSMTWLK